MRAKRRLDVMAWVTALVTLASTPAWGTSLLPVNLQEMVDRSDRIVLARAVDEWTGRDSHGIPATITTFEVNRSWKGGPLRTMQIKQLGVTRVQPDGLATWVEGMPKYEKGAEYLLFLKPDSQLGFTSPVGAFQGAFAVRAAGDGDKAVVNGLDNANLLRGLDEERLARLGLGSEAFPFLVRGRGPLHLEELGSMIDRLLGRR